MMLILQACYDAGEIFVGSIVAVISGRSIFGSGKDTPNNSVFTCAPTQCQICGVYANKSMPVSTASQ
ncbi:MAG: hypothetical protein M3247_02465 [Thermoproteota archaeon]|nr:hypothetical protein [Thermoproteota archaeon]